LFSDKDNAPLSTFRAKANPSYSIYNLCRTYSFDPSSDVIGRIHDKEHQSDAEHDALDN
jgi:hypothetical protein